MTVSEARTLSTTSSSTSSSTSPSCGRSATGSRCAASAKQALDNVGVAIATARDQVEVTSDAEVWTSVSQSSTDLVDYVIVFDDQPASDATRPLVSFDDGGSGGFAFTPNGSNITWTPDSTNGIIYYDYGA